MIMGLCRENLLIFPPDSRFNQETPNVVHMTIKPQEYVEDEDAKGGKGSFANNRESNERSPGCRCVIM
jgi:hypothetical protein